MWSQDHHPSQSSPRRILGDTMPMRIPSLSSYTHKRLLISGAGLALMLIGLVVGFVARPDPMHVHARILLQAILEEDGATILRYVHPVERELNDLTPETTAALVSEMINARYEAWGWTPKAESMSWAADSHSHSGMAKQMGRIPGVGRVPRLVQVRRMERGRPTIALSELISGMWAKERIWELRRQGKSQTVLLAAPSVLAKSWLEGFDRHERRLRELGVRYHTGVNFDAGTVRFISFDDRRRVLLDWVANPDTIFDPVAQQVDYHNHARLWMTVEQAREHKRQRAQGR